MVRIRISRLLKIEELEARVTPSFLYFPNTVPGLAPEADPRFLSVAGDGLATLASQPIQIEFAVPGPASLLASSTLTIGVYDGDTGGLWDEGTTPLQYALYADSAGDGTGVNNPPIMAVSGADMGDQQWYNMAVNTSSDAAKADGSYYMYTLRVTAPLTAETFSSNFKLRADGGVAGLDGGGVQIIPQYFAFLTPMFTLGGARIIYPNWDQGYRNETGPTSYDGTWDFSFWVPSPSTALAVWDGDFDYGSYPGDPNGQTFDTNDPDCSGVIPSWANPASTSAQGVAVGLPGSTSDPNDDIKISILRRSPSVTYEVIDPNGTQYWNNNPSGNQEWEKFWIDTNQSNSLADYRPASLPAGTYTIHVKGLDIGNLVAFHFEATPLASPVSSLGGTAWHDLFHSSSHAVDGIQDAGEPGLAGILMQLLNTGGSVLATTTTNSSGYYGFTGLAAGTYVVKGADSNFASGGPLAGWYASQANVGSNDSVDSDGNETTHKATVTVAAGQNNTTVDFGFFHAAIDLTKTGPASVVYGPVVALSPSNGQTYTSPINHQYTVEDPATSNPFYSIKFNEQGEGVQGGASDTFTFAISSAAYDTLQLGNKIRVSAKAGTTQKTAYLPINGTVTTGSFQFTFVAAVDNGSQTSITIQVKNSYTKALSNTAFELPSTESITYHFRVVNTGDLVLHGGAHVYDAMLNTSGDHEIWTAVVWPGEVYEFDKIYTPTQAGTLTNTATAIGHPEHPGRNGAYEESGTTDDYYVADVSAADSWTVQVRTDGGCSSSGLSAGSVALLDGVTMLLTNPITLGDSSGPVDAGPSIRPSPLPPTFVLSPSSTGKLALVGGPVSKASSLGAAAGSLASGGTATVATLPTAPVVFGGIVNPLGQPGGIVPNAAIEEMRNVVARAGIFVKPYWQLMR